MRIPNTFSAFSEVTCATCSGVHLINLRYFQKGVLHIGALIPLFRDSGRESDKGNRFRAQYAPKELSAKCPAKSTFLKVTTPLIPNINPSNSKQLRRFFGCPGETMKNAGQWGVFIGLHYLIYIFKRFPGMNYNRKVIFKCPLDLLFKGQTVARSEKFYPNKGRVLFLRWPQSSLGADKYVHVQLPIPASYDSLTEVGCSPIIG